VSGAGNPIAGASLYLYGSNGFNYGPVTTDEVGSYTFTAVSTSAFYYLRTFNQAGYIDQLYQGIVCKGSCVFNTPSFASSVGATHITVTNGTTKVINFNLAVGGQFTGTVTNESGMPIANVAIAVPVAGVTFLGYARTDANGVYVATGLPTGSYIAYTSNNGTTGYLNQMYNAIPCGTTNCNTSLATAISVTAGATTPNINFSLTRGSTISGRVTDITGTALAGIEIDVPQGVQNPYTAVTDANGNYTVVGLPASTYTARTNANATYVNQYYSGLDCGVTCSGSGATAIPVSAGAAVTNINFTLKLAGSITGTVLNRSGVPVAGQWIDLYNGSGNSVASAAADSNGVYLIPGIPAGTYFLQSNSDLGYLRQLYNGILCSGCTVTSGTPVTVTAGATTSGIDFSIGKAGTISGVVTGTGGVPLVGVFLNIHNSPFTTSSNQQTKAGGVYTFGGLTPGDYVVSTSVSGYVNQMYNGINCAIVCPPTGTPIHVDYDATIPINFALDTGGGISGTVTGNNGLPVSGRQIVLYNPTGDFTSTTTDVTGKYTFGGLATGIYFALSGAQAYNGIACNSCNVVNFGTPISVTAPAVTNNINFVLAPVLNSITPASGLVGAAVDVTLTGSGFNAAMTLNVGPGITPTNLILINSTLATAHFVISNSAATGNRNVTATYLGFTSAAVTFTVNTLSTLTVTKTGTGVGVVSSTPTGINCGVTCNFTFTSADNVTLTAVPAAGSVFSGWRGDADCLDGSVSMSANRSCQAVFDLPQSNLKRLRGDFNGEGKSDLVWQHTDGSTTLWLMDGKTMIAGAGLIGANTGWTVRQRSDFNGDGKTDILWANIDGSSAVWLMDGQNMIAGALLIGPGTGWTASNIGDFDGDGKSDIVWEHTDGSSALWLMDGVNLKAGAGLLGPGTGWSVKQIGDFDGDGKSDIVWQHTNGSVSVWLMNGMSPSSGGGWLGAGTGWTPILIGDFDGDGKSDILWQHPDGSVAMWLVDGLGLKAAAIVLGPETGWSPKDVGDFNGDGKSDIVWQHSDGSAAMWLVDGLGIFAGTIIRPPNTGYSVAGIGDFDGDGKSDIIWQHTDGSIDIWLMDGLTRASSGILLGPATGWSPAP
jgi:hypothetical protein